MNAQVVVVQQTTDRVVEVSSPRSVAVVVASPAASIVTREIEQRVVQQEPTRPAVIEVGIPGPASAVPGPAGPAGGTSFVRVAGADLGGHRIVRSVNAATAGYASNDDLTGGEDTLGMTLGAAVAGADVAVQNMGSVVFNGWAWTPHEPVFLGVDGQITQVVPAVGFLQVIGHAEDATTLNLHIEPPIFLE